MNNCNSLEWGVHNFAIVSGMSVGDMRNSLVV